MFRIRKSKNAATSLLVLLGVLQLRVLAAGQADVHLPIPDGCYNVGTKTVVLRDAHRRRNLLLTMWYPTPPGRSQPAPYMDKRTADAFAEEWELEPNFQLRVHAHSELRATIVQKKRFPVVLVEHGSSVVPAIYTTLAEGLASNGYVVVATNHPQDSLIAAFPDGHEEKFAPYWPESAPRREQGIAIGKFAEEVLLVDVRFVLDNLAAMNSRDPFWRGHLDMSKVAIVGHSMGGTTAALATLKEPRILAGVNLDGSTFPGMNNDVRPMALGKPLLFLATEEHASGEGHAREYIGSESNTYYVVLKGTEHMSFTDGSLLKNRFKRQGDNENGAFDREMFNLTLTRSLVEEFLGKHLKGSIASFLDSRAQIEHK